MATKTKNTVASKKQGFFASTKQKASNFATTVKDYAERPVDKKDLAIAVAGIIAGATLAG